MSSLGCYAINTLKTYRIKFISYDILNPKHNKCPKLGQNIHFVTSNVYQMHNKTIFEPNYAIIHENTKQMFQNVNV